MEKNKIEKIIFELKENEQKIFQLLEERENITKGLTDIEKDKVFDGLYKDGLEHLEI